MSLQLLACALAGDSRALRELHDALLDLGRDDGSATATVESLRHLLAACSDGLQLWPQPEHLALQDDFAVVAVQDDPRHESFLRLLRDAADGNEDFVTEAIDVDDRIFLLDREALEGLLNRFFGHEGEVGFIGWKHPVRLPQLQAPLIWRVSVRMSLLVIKADTSHRSGKSVFRPPTIYVPFAYYA